MRSVVSIFLTFLPLLAFADVEFVSPAPGATLSAGPITITWKDSGDAPALASLTTYTLQLFVGGNTADDSQPLTAFIANGKFSSGNSFTGSIEPGLSSSIANGFYIGITSPVPGGEIINYSGRFSISGMNGSPPSATIVQAIQDLGKSTAGPKTINTANNNANAAAPAAGGAGAVGSFAIPYNLQTGLTKYAPMQPVPGTKITQQSFTPMFPTSAYTVAKTWLPQASIVTTLTAPQTFSVSSMENPASPQSQPTGDMARFLARWKD